MLIFLGNVEQLNNAGQNYSELNAIGQDIFEVCYELVRKERREKADKIKLEKQRNTSILAGLLLNYATGEYERRCTEAETADNNTVELEKVDVSTLISSYNKAYDYELTTEANGKPAFKDRDNIYFNISHSGSCVVCAIDDKPVGIDIEGERNNVLKVAKRFFTQKEYNWVAGAEQSEEAVKSDKDSMAKFLRIWTMKEAYSKLTGMGIAVGISKVEFLPDDIAANGNRLGGRGENKGLNVWELRVSDDSDFRISVIQSVY